MYQPLIKFHPHPAIITQVLAIFEKILDINNIFIGESIYNPAFTILTKVFFTYVRYNKKGCKFYRNSQPLLSIL